MTTELANTGDGFALGVSNLLGQIEGNGGKPNGIVGQRREGNPSRRAFVRRQNEAGLHGTGFGREPDTIYGVPIKYSSNLDALPAAAGKIAAVVGDFTHAVFALRRDISVRFSDQATIDVGGTLHHLWQQNKTAHSGRRALASSPHDLNRMFGNITNAA